MDLTRRDLSGLSIGSILSIIGSAQASPIGMRNGGPFLKVHHLYDGPDGKAKIDTFEMNAKGEAGWSIKFLMEAPAESTYISAAPPGHFIDWHLAKKPQFFIAMQGIFETGLEDGSKHRLMPGELLLAEDKISKGHTSRVVSKEWAIQFCCVLKDSGAVYRPTFP
jgi:hypothetical protein